MEITKEEIEKLIKMPGKVRGEVLRTDARFILDKKGKKGLEVVQKDAKRLGISIPYETAEPLGWYQVGLRALSFMVIKKALNWGDKELIEMGYAAPAYSFVVRLLIKYFISFEKVLKESPKYWKKHYTVGRLEARKLDMKKKYFILRIHDFKAHPLCCVFYLGYFKRMAEFGGQKNITVKETKCMFKGDPYHEFLVTWG